MSCSFCHRCVQLILGYSCARSAVLAAGKCRGGGMGGGGGGEGGGGGCDDVISSLPSLSFISLFLSYPALSSPLLFYLFSPFLWETTQNDPQELTCH